MRLASASLAILVPLCSIVGQEVWLLTANLRYPVGAASDSLKMSAAVYGAHGPPREVLAVDPDRAQPLLPAAPGLIVINVTAAALNPVDFKQMRSDQPNALAPKPRIAGFDVSGVVVSAGEGSGFAAGDAVFGMLPLVGSPWGSLAELTVGDARCFARAPESIPLEEAAALPLVALTVMQVFDQAELVAAGARTPDRKNQRILVHAAAGGVGSFAVQYARNVLGFGHVVGTCSSKNAELVAGLGATATIDYAVDDFVEELVAAGGVDAVLDPMSWRYMERTLSAHGVLRPAAKYCHVLSSDWQPNAAERSLATILQGPVAKWASRLRGLVLPATPQVFSTPVQPDAASLERLAALVDSGHVKPVIDRVFEGLPQAADALAYVQEGHARGKVVVRVSR